ncbi:hypothetical protein ACTA71_009035 [Dictyostelium dimigraforme]
MNDQTTNFTNDNNSKPMMVREESIEKVKGIISSVEKTPPPKRGRNDNDENDINIEPIKSNNYQNIQKVNKFDNKESTGFKTASNMPIRVNKETLNNEKSKIDTELQQDIDINNYKPVLAILEQPFKMDPQNT